MNQANELQEKFGHDNHIVFEQLDSGIVLAKIDNALATAIVSLYGGQVIQWQPKSQVLPVLWMSDLAQYLPGKAIRGGIPVCWPWFGAHPEETKLPSHGYARISECKITSVATDLSGATVLCMAWSAPDDHLGLSGIPATLSIRITVGEFLSVELTTTSTASETITFTEALHTYFKVSDISRVQIFGLNACRYVDLIDNNSIKTQSDSISFSEETGRVYVGTDADCFLVDPGLKRTIRVSKSGSQSTVVWNPWLDTATKMDDLGPTGWKTMVCIESANALQNTVTLAPGAHHTIAVNYSVTDELQEHP